MVMHSWGFFHPPRGKASKNFHHDGERSFLFLADAFALPP